MENSRKYECFQKKAASSFHKYQLSPQNVPQSPQYLLVPQAVDKGVEHGGDENIKHKEMLVHICGERGTWGHVDDHSWTKVEAHYTEVGRAGGQSFVSALRGVHMEDSEKDEDVGGQNESKRYEEENNASY